jgi:hypothetical protein
MPILNQLIAGSMAVIGLGGAGIMASTNPAIKADLASVQTAITNKDLSAYKTAEKQLITDRASAENTRVDATTQDQLNTISDKQAKGKAVQDAITNNEYDAFKANADQKMLQRVTDQAGFDKLVASSKARTEAINKISEAIKNNDFATFKSAELTEKTDRGGKSRPAPTDVELQTRFDQLVANYKADGSLPRDQKGFGGFEMGGRGHGGGHGHNFEENR